MTRILRVILIALGLVGAVAAAAALWRWSEPIGLGEWRAAQPAIPLVVVGVFAAVVSWLVAALAYHGRVLLQTIGVMAVMLVAAGVATLLMIAPQAAPRQPQIVIGPLVEVVMAELRDVPVIVRGQGTVQPGAEARIVPQVGGRVLQTHPNLTVGGFIPAGEAVLVMDGRDYELALASAQAEMARAQADLGAAGARVAEAQAQAADARRDLARVRELFARNAAHQREIDKAQLAVDLAEAQVRSMQAAAESVEAHRASARAAAEQAQVHLDRTTLRLPFDAVVVEEQVNEGQHVTAGQSVGRVYSTDTVRIIAPIEDRELGWLTELPMGQRGEGGRSGPPLSAEVRAEFLGRPCIWQGVVVRTEPQVDPRSRMVGVVVEVADPFAGAEADKPPLMPGAFVEVAIEGRTMQSVIPLPRHAVHGRDEVWVARDGRLEIRQVDVVRRERQQVFIRSGVREGDAVIVTPLEVVSEGMRVRVSGAEAEAEEQNRSTTAVRAAGDKEANSP